MAFMISVAIIIATAFVFAHLMLILHPLSVDVGGIIFPSRRGGLYKFTGRPSPESPVIEIAVYLEELRDDVWEHVEIRVFNFIRETFRAIVKMEFVNHEHNVVAEGKVEFKIRYRERRELSIPIAWKPGTTYRDVYYISVKGNFVSSYPMQ